MKVLARFGLVLDLLLLVTSYKEPSNSEATSSLSSSASITSATRLHQTTAQLSTWLRLR